VKTAITYNARRASDQTKKKYSVEEGLWKKKEKGRNPRPQQCGKVLTTAENFLPGMRNEKERGKESYRFEP